MLSKNKIALVAYRSIKAKETTFLTAKKDNTLNDDVQKSIIKKEIKERKESAEFTEKEYNLSVATILEALLPTALTEEEITVEVLRAINNVDAHIKSDFGKVMKELKQNPKEIDMKIASKLLSLFLT